MEIGWGVFPRLVGTGWLVGWLGEVGAAGVVEEIRTVGLVLSFALEKDLDTIAMSDLVGLWGFGLQLHRRVDAIIIGLGKGLLQVKVQKATAVD